MGRSDEVYAAHGRVETRTAAGGGREWVDVVADLFAVLQKLRGGHFCQVAGL